MVVTNTFSQRLGITHLKTHINNATIQLLKSIYKYSANIQMADDFSQHSLLVKKNCRPRYQPEWLRGWINNRVCCVPKFDS